MNKRKAFWLRPLLVSALALLTSLATAQNSDFDDLQMNGLAAFEQLRMEYYIGALYVESMSDDAATLAAAPGRKRMALHISADRWPALRFAQQWNQAILINNGSQELNANVMDVLAFTSLPKDDLISGDRLTIDLIPNLGTRVTLNGTPMLQTQSDALFRLLLNTWVGARPPSSGFKRDILKLPTDATATELLARYEGLNASAARSKLVAGWAGKIEAVAPVETVAAAGPTENTVVRARSEVAAPVAAVAVAAPVVAAPTVAAPAVAAPAIAAPVAAVAAVETPAVAAAAKPAAASAPTPAAAPTPAPAPAPVAAAVPVVAAAQPVAAAPAIDTSAQQALHNAYTNSLRKLIYAELRYPKRAVKKEIEGLVVLRISSNRNGQLLAATVAQGAHQILDDAAQEAATRAAPFPAVASEMNGENFDFMIPVVFKLAD